MHAHTRCTCIEWNRSTVLHSSEATVWDWEKRGSIYSPLFPTSAEHQCGDVAWSVWFQLRTFSSDHGSQEVEVEEEEKQNPPRWLNRRPPEGLLDSSYMWSCHGDILRDRLLLTGAALCAGFSGDQSLFYEWSVRVKCAEAGIMSSGRLSHLLRGVWLLWLWQGESRLCAQDDFTHI